jgi:HPt (histidine-containing phosphotransfer) domain-containing protein
MVITDCHMPEMDGYELSQKIRELESNDARNRTPVIAWTANALAEEEGRCQAAGMDELLVKPANLGQLRKILAKWLSITEPEETATLSSQHDKKEDAKIVIDYEVLNSVVPDSSDRGRVLKEFLSHISTDHSKLSEILKEGDPASVANTAHRMKGSCRMVGAMHLAKACEIIEQAARDDDMTKARATKKALDEALSQIESLLMPAEKQEEI